MSRKPRTIGPFLLLVAGSILTIWGLGRNKSGQAKKRVVRYS